MRKTLPLTMLTKRHVRPPDFCGVPWIDVSVAHRRHVRAGRGSWVGCGYNEGDGLVVVPVQRYEKQHGSNPTRY